MALQLYLSGLSVQREGFHEDDFLAEAILQDWKQRILKRDNAYYCYYWIQKRRTMFIVTDIEIYDEIRNSPDSLENHLRSCAIQQFASDSAETLETDQLMSSGFYPAYRLLRKMQANINHLSIMEMPALIDPENPLPHGKDSDTLTAGRGNGDKNEH